MEHFLDYFEPEHYNLEECIWRETEKFKGKVEIIGRLKPGKSCIKLHAVDLEIDRVEWCIIYDDEIDYDYLNYVSCGFSYHDDILEIPFDAKKLSELNEQENLNRLVLKINFRGQLNRNMQGCYLSTYDFEGVEQRLVATQFESHYAREAFPCIDEPAAKATFALTIILPDFSEKDVILANTPVIGQVNGKFEFATTPRMSTYLLAWVAGPLKSISTVNQNGVKVSSYCALNQPVESLLFANETAARALEYYDERFQEKYPLPKLDQVALPDFEAGAMENWGLVTFRESMMLANQNASLDVKRSVAVTVAHELSHQWFGDLVTMSWWDDLWLNESFATIMEYYATDALYPDYNIWEDFFTGECLAALKRDSLPDVQSVKQDVNDPAEIATLFDSAIVYAKGARLILMLIRAMGEDGFYQGIRDYFKKYKYQNTIGDDLWSVLQPYSDFDVKAFMHSWIDRPGFPLVDETGSECRFYLDGRDSPVLDSTQAWPLPGYTDDMSGHFLLNLSDQDFHHKLQQFDNLSMEQKLRLLIDRMFLSKTPKFESSVLLDLLPKFKDETSSSVWAILASIINDLKLFCPPHTPSSDRFHQYLKDIFQFRWNQLDLQKPSSDANFIALRSILLSIGTYSEDRELIRRLADLYQDDLSRLDPDLRENILLAKLRLDESVYFAKFLDFYRSSTNPDLKDELLAVVANFSREEEHISELISLLEQPEVVRPQDHLFLYVYLLRNHYSSDRALEWLLSHWDYVKQLTGDKTVEDYVRCTSSAIRTESSAQKFFTFFDQFSDDPVLSRAIKNSHADIPARLRLISHDSPAVHARLQELVKSCDL